MVSLRDVARKAGVSPATASLALNNSDKVSKKTLEKVQEIARMMNYIPDARARALACKMTKIIGLVIPDIKNPFFSEMAQIIKNAAKKSGYNIILCGVENIEEELSYINMFKGMQVDGAVFTSSKKNANSSIISDLAANYIPVVYIDRVGNDDDTVPIIKPNLQDATYQATKHLIDLGHRRIAFAGQEGEERMVGFSNAVRAHNLEIGEEYYLFETKSFEDGYNLGERLSQEKSLPTGIVCHNDEVAIGLIQSLIKSGINVPEDISVCGIDNIVLSKFYNPPLTTVHLPKKEMGERAVKLLLDMMAGKELTIEERYIRYPVELIVRGSTERI